LAKLVKKEMSKAEALPAGQRSRCNSTSSSNKTSTRSAKAKALKVKEVLNTNMVIKRTKEIERKRPEAKCGKGFRYCNAIDMRPFDEQPDVKPWKTMIINDAEIALEKKTGKACHQGKTQWRTSSETLTLPPPRPEDRPCGALQHPIMSKAETHSPRVRHIYPSGFEPKPAVPIVIPTNNWFVYLVTSTLPIPDVESHES